MKTKVILILLVLCNTMLFAQVKVADNFFRDYAYIKASELYEAAVKKGDSSEHVLTRIGDCYYNNSNSEKAAMWYGKAVNKYKNINPEFIYKYIQSLRSLGKYEDANTWITKFKELQTSDKRAEDFEIMDLAKYQELSSTEGKYVEFSPLAINTEYSEFGGYLHEDTFYYASTKVSGEGGSGKIYKWNEEPYLDIFSGTINNEKEDASIEDIKALTNEINSEFHEATVAITNDGKTMYFTRDNINNRKKISYDDEGTSYLKIYKATKSGDSWSNVVALPINDKIYSTGHPALSADNKILYFVSDREGGYGGTDIYSVEIRGDNGYGKPENLGEKINTPGREMFPYVAKDSTFYFSSDGHISLGLLDIFKSNLIKAKVKDSIKEPENMGAPFNSRFDDFAFFIDSDKETGFLSSNREEGSGSDDIYQFGSFQCKQVIKGVVRDEITSLPIPEAKVKLLDETGKELEEIISDENGAYEFEVDCEKKYTLIGSKLDYREDIQEVETTDVPEEEQVQDLLLTPFIVNNEIVINPIFFDYDKSNIRPDAAYELENIVTVMKNHPKMHIKIEAHTDSRGRDAYNEKLSDKRAKSTRDYIISRGITSNRIDSAIGYGEYQLLNECANGVKCSEEKHQENRRSKFIITNEY
ncbi:OmpA family protein [Oceanihabitans sp. 2_MG-2023]|uniref:OmpA family protein n=1 Tax=Oceanihabitans sp. 2_MG-2023 TaxID=3062661 RepID=UPI0026E2FF4F|nr:OmpA family protein [Oceanihabitans sp. 2_MG-2023]MDO6597556.1 OmpA family protein [Oceanihabitans sp. 2_MG-2023]